VYLNSAADPTWDPDCDGEVDPALLLKMAKSPPTEVICRDAGTNIQKILNVVANLGVPEEQNYRQDGNFGIWPCQEKGSVPLLPPGDTYVNFTHDPWITACSVLKASSMAAQPPSPNCYSALYRHLNIQYMVLDVAQTATIEADWKKALAAGHPIIFAIAFIQALFDSLTGDNRDPDPVKDPRVMPVPGPKDVADDGHVMLAVGWNDHVTDSTGKDHGGCFLVQNSWGDWTPGGTFWMPYSFFTTASGRPDEKMVTFSLAMIGTTARANPNNFVRLA
jgi:hypothetical protein